MDKPLAGCVAAVTGASLGVGRAAALAFARAGADLVLCARGPEINAVAHEAEAQGARVLARCCDVTERAAVRRFGRLDILVNNAAVLGPRVTLAEFPAADFARVLDVNIQGVFHATQAALEFSMLKRRAGIIINMSSGVGRVGFARGGAYTVSKFALEGLTQVAAKELKDSGIGVCSFNPGMVRTRMRAAWAPGEDPTTLKSPDALGPQFVALVTAGMSCAGRCYCVTADGMLAELQPPEGTVNR